MSASQSASSNPDSGKSKPSKAKPSGTAKRTEQQRQPKGDLPKVNPDLQGFAIEVDRFGTVHSNVPVDRLNRFLDREVSDRKLEDRSGPHGEEPQENT